MLTYDRTCIFLPGENTMIECLPKCGSHKDKNVGSWVYSCAWYCESLFVTQGMTVES